MAFDIAAIIQIQPFFSFMNFCFVRLSQALNTNISTSSPWERIMLCIRNAKMRLNSWNSNPGIQTLFYLFSSTEPLSPYPMGDRFTFIGQM